MKKAIGSKKETLISPETKGSLASKAVTLHANKLDLIKERDKALQQQLCRDRKGRIRKVILEIEEKLVGMDVIGSYTM